MSVRSSKLEVDNSTVRNMDVNTLLGNVTCAAKRPFSFALEPTTFAKNTTVLTRLLNLETVVELIVRWECPIHQQAETQWRAIIHSDAACAETLKRLVKELIQQSKQLV